MINKNDYEAALEAYNAMHHQWCVSKKKTIVPNEVSNTIRAALKLAAKIMDEPSEGMKSVVADKSIAFSSPHSEAGFLFKIMRDQMIKEIEG